eukprot:2435965-Prymnesium_polylepis.1
MAPILVHCRCPAKPWGGHVPLAHTIMPRLCSGTVTVPLRRLRSAQDVSLRDCFRHALARS